MAKTTEFKQERIDSMIEFQNFSKASNKLNIRLSGYRKYILRAQQEGWIKKVAGSWKKGDLYKSCTLQSGHNDGQLEVHRLEIKFPVFKPSSAWQSQKPKIFDVPDYNKSSASISTNEKMRLNHHYFVDMPLFYVKTTTKNVILVQKAKEKVDNRELYDRTFVSNSPRDLREKIMRIGIDFKEVLEKRFWIKLGSVDGVEFEINSQHWAHLRTPIAKEFIAQRVDLKVYNENGELDTIVDCSDPAHPHFEHVNVQTSPMNADRWQPLINKINSGEFNADIVLNKIDGHDGHINGVRGDLKRQVEVVDKILVAQEMMQNDQGKFRQDINYFGEKIEAHTLMVEKAVSVFSKMDENLTRDGNLTGRKLNKASPKGLLKHLMVKCKRVEDVVRFGDYVKLLSVEDKEVFSDWIFEKF